MPSIWFDEDVGSENLKEYEACLLESHALSELIIGGKLKAGALPAFFSMLAALVQKSSSLQSLRCVATAMTRLLGKPLAYLSR